MAISIPEDVVAATRMTEAELKQEFAVLLFERDRLTLAQAARFADMSRIRFQQLLASREIPVHYDIEDYREDLDTLRRLGQLE